MNYNERNQVEKAFRVFMRAYIKLILVHARSQIKAWPAMRDDYFCAKWFNRNEHLIKNPSCGQQPLPSIDVDRSV